jgi:hypothetical protein
MRRPLVALLLAGIALTAADAPKPTADAPKPPTAAPETLLAQTEKLVGSDDMTKGSPASLWKVTKGRWERNDLGTSGAEVPADKHNAIMRLPVKLDAFVVSFDVRLDGAASFAFTINNAKEHLARAIVAPTYVSLRRDDYDGDGPEKAYTLFTKPTPNDPGTWHNVVFEMVGDTVVLTVDGKISGWGADPAFIKDIRANPSFHIDGAFATVRNFRLWTAKAEPKPTWAAKKATLPKPLEKMKK